MCDILKSGYYESPLGYNTVDWFVDEVIYSKNGLLFHKDKKDIIMTEEDEEHYKNINIFRLCVEIIESDEVRDHCHLTSGYRRPAHRKCAVIVEKPRSKLITIAFHNFSNSDCHLVFRKLVDIKNDRVNFKNIPETNDETFKVKYG